MNYQLLDTQSSRYLLSLGRTLLHADMSVTPAMGDMLLTPPAETFL